MAMKFMNGLNIMISELAQPTALKDAAETLAFQHLEIDVTTPRAGVFRQAILDLMEMELGQRFSSEERVSIHHCERRRFDEYLLLLPSSKYYSVLMYLLRYLHVFRYI